MDYITRDTPTIKKIVLAFIAIMLLGCGMLAAAFACAFACHDAPANSMIEFLWFAMGMAVFAVGCASVVAAFGVLVLGIKDNLKK